MENYQDHEIAETVKLNLEMPKISYERLSDVARRNGSTLGGLLAWCVDNCLNLQSDREQFDLYKDFRATCPFKHLHPMRTRTGQVLSLVEKRKG